MLAQWILVSRPGAVVKQYPFCIPEAKFYVMGRKLDVLKFRHFCNLSPQGFSNFRIFEERMESGCIGLSLSWAQADSCIDDCRVLKREKAPVAVSFANRPSFRLVGI